MIRIKPYYERPNRDEIERAYLRMVAATTPFLPEDVLFDDPEGQACYRRQPKQRTQNGKPSGLAQLMGNYSVQDGSDTQGKLRAEAEVAERIVESYSDELHEFLYQGSTTKGHVNRENLRALLLLRLPNGQIPDGFRFHEGRSGTAAEQDRRAKELLAHVFCYKGFSALGRPRSGWHCSIHQLVALLDVKVCPYCNRQFTTTLSETGRGVRPQLDHFRSKSAYPFLALSINNLVPTCGVCNLLKSNKDCDLVYPYDEDFEAAGYAFRTSIPADHTVPALEGIAIAEEDFRISVERQDPGAPAKDEECCKRVERSLDELCLTELYQSHRDYAAFLYRQRYVLTGELAQDLHDQFPALFKSADEVRHVFALMHTDQAHFGDRPLAKLTHDILHEIEELYGG